MPMTLNLNASQAHTNMVVQPKIWRMLLTNSYCLIKHYLHRDNWIITLHYI